MPAVVRLQSLDDCLRSWPQAPGLVKAAAPGGNTGTGSLGEVAGMQENGEFTARDVSATCVPAIENVSEVVEGGPPMMDALTDADRNALRDLLINPNEDPSPVSVLRVGLEPHGVWLFPQIVPDLVLESFESLIRTCESQADLVRDGYSHEDVPYATDTLVIS